MTKRISKRQRAINLVAKGYSNKYIFEHFPTISRQTVYNARWAVNKKKGLASLPKPEPVATGTGITSSASAIPLQFAIIDRPAKKQSNARRNAQLARRRRERLERAMQDQMNSIPRSNLGNFYPDVVRTKPTLWQKIKSFFGV